MWPWTTMETSHNCPCWRCWFSFCRMVLEKSGNSTRKEFVPGSISSPILFSAARERKVSANSILKAAQHTKTSPKFHQVLWPLGTHPPVPWDRLNTLILPAYKSPKQNKVTISNKNKHDSYQNNRGEGGTTGTWEGPGEKQKDYGWGLDYGWGVGKIACWLSMSLCSISMHTPKGKEKGMKNWIVGRRKCLRDRNDWAQPHKLKDKCLVPLDPSEEMGMAADGCNPNTAGCRPQDDPNPALGPVNLVNQLVPGSVRPCFKK